MILERKKILILWFLFLLASFAYEKPIFIISNMDRINPRLFDIATILALFILPFTKSIRLQNPIFLKYKYLLIWFGVCVIFSLLIYGFPFEINSYILFYYFKYLQELFVLWVASKILMEFIPLKWTFRIFILSGLFVFLYSIYEFNYGMVGEIEFAPGKFVMKPPGVIWGPFGNTYFQIANYLPFLFIITYGFATLYKGTKRILLYLCSGFIAWPLFFTGSRTGLALLLISLAVFLLVRYRIYYSIWVVVFISLLAITFFTIFNNQNIQTLDRLEGMENNENNSIISRITLFEEFQIDSYAEDGILLPLFGGGFYVAPANGNFRIGYGFHNIYVFAFEQAGLIGFILFIALLRKSYKILREGLKYFKPNKRSLEYVFIATVFSYFIAEIITGFAGHTFWRGFATNNFNTLRILILIMAFSLIYSNNDGSIQIEKE